MNERIRKRKKRRNRIVIVTVAVIALICLLAHLFVNSQLIKGILYRGDSYSSKTVLEVDKSISGSYSVFGDNIIFTNKNGVIAYNQNGELSDTEAYDQFSSALSGYSKPVIRVEGKYLLGFDANGRKLTVFNGKKIVHQTETEYNLQSVKVFEDGCFAAITGDAGAKNQMVFHNEKGEKIFIWHSGVDNILDAAALPKGKKIAVLTSSLESGNISSRILFFNKGEAEAYATYELADTFVTNIEFAGKKLVALSDGGINYLNTDGVLKNSYSFDEKFLKYFEITENGSAVLSFGSVSNSLNTVEIVSPGGKLKGSYTTEDEIIGISFKNNNILLSHRHSADIISMRGNPVRHIDCDREMRKVSFIGRNKIVLIGNSEVKIIK